MRRLLLVSRNLSLQLGLAGHFDVVEERPAAGWRLHTDALHGIDAVVLELRDDDATLLAVRDARAVGFAGPVLAISVDADRLPALLEGVAAGVQVLRLPVSADQLNATLDLMLGGERRRSRRAPHHDAEAAAGEPLVLEPDAVLLEEAAAEPVAVVGAAAAPAPTLPARPLHDPPPAERIEVTPPVAVPLPAPQPGVERHPSRRERKAREPEPRAAEPRAPEPRAAEPRAPERPGREPELSGLVRALLDRHESLQGVTEATTGLLEDLLAALGAEAGVVLVPDGPYWRVTAGAGVRHVEWRLALGADSWLIDEAAVQGHGVIVSGSDIARQRLSGVPLASWEHLMAAPMRGSRVVLLLARKEQPFAQRDLESMVTGAAAHAAAVSDALAVRALARALARFADEETAGD